LDAIVISGLERLNFSGNKKKASYIVLFFLRSINESLKVNEFKSPKSNMTLEKIDPNLFPIKSTRVKARVFFLSAQVYELGRLIPAL